MLRWLDAFSIGNIATWALVRPAHACRLAATPITAITRPAALYVIGIAPVKWSSLPSCRQDLHDVGRVTDMHATGAGARAWAYIPACITPIPSAPTRRQHPPGC